MLYLQISDLLLLMLNIVYLLRTVCPCSGHSSGFMTQWNVSDIYNVAQVVLFFMHFHLHRIKIKLATEKALEVHLL